MKKLLPVSLFLGISMSPFSAHAAEIRMSKAELGAQDKITGRYSTLSATLNQPITFGALTITLKACITRPPEESPENAAFVEVEEKKASGDMVPVFKGFLFSSSPSLSAMDHAIFDIWSLKCTGDEISPILEGLSDEDMVRVFNPPPPAPLAPKQLTPPATAPTLSPFSSEGAIKQETSGKSPLPPTIDDDQRPSPAAMKKMLEETGGE